MNKASSLKDARSPRPSPLPKGRGGMVGRLLRRRIRIGVQFAEAFAVGGGPGGNVAGEIGGEDALAIMSEGGSEGEFIVEFEFSTLRAIRIPNRDIVITATGDQAPIAVVAKPKLAL